MLIFESLSLGTFAVLVVMAGVLVLVGAYVYLVWPLTGWDLVEVSVEKLDLWSEFALGLVFMAGSAAGFWCFSGAAFRPKKRAPRSP